MAVCAKRPAFTLVELLVVIAIIGILIALLLPAVQAARETARRTQCTNNLMQVGLALHLFHDREGRFPPAHSQDPRLIPDNFGQPAPPDEFNFFSWMTRILPYIEQNNLYDLVRWDEWPWPHANPAGGYLNSEKIKTYRCPSDVRDVPAIFDWPPEVEMANTSYLGVNGTDQFSYDGILHVNSTVRIADVKDGTSNTLLVGERPPSYDLDTGWWFAGSGWYPWFGAADVVLGSNERIAIAGASEPDGPQSKYQPGTLQYEEIYGWDKHAFHFWSVHPGGANFLFADGHVSFIPYTIPEDLLGKLATHQKGEVIDAAF